MPSPSHPVASVHDRARLCVNPAFPAETDAPSRTVADTHTALLPPYPRAAGHAAVPLLPLPAIDPVAEEESVYQPASLRNETITAVRSSHAADSRPMALSISAYHRSMIVRSAAGARVPASPGRGRPRRRDANPSGMPVKAMTSSVPAAR